MKNIRNYKSENYKKSEYEEVEPDIYKTMETPSENSIALKGVSEEEGKIIRDLEGWEQGKPDSREEDFYFINYNGKKYYKYVDEADDKDCVIYVEQELKPIYVTSIVFEPEPEFGENEPSESLISQYPINDVFDKFYVYGGESYEEENENDKFNNYIEFVSPDIDDIRNVRTIIGKHVYNKEINENAVDLIIE
ncbi:hypothetical protein BCR32DRAFT_326053 [Anaeromyces robustus]|uniref:Uncharacterized protein n=1 Tax=Anaeromyces robustus TaxID=1754192 RepID=A0A1Y1XFL5_9FUNG|nr:hypothetical protein BCR32DRAFT_326053 [Anaeromyces robustus]|eukprot:ORX84174.1 hypothetical protein BCR32DRAFT_326053 [Anaeromyces robustus]